MNQTITISISNIKNSKKPDKKNRQLQARINNSFAVEVMSVQDFAAKIVQPNGYTFCPAVLKDGIRKNENWISQQVLALDIDSGLTYDDFMARSKKYGITPTVIYDTFSSRNHDRIRVIYVLPVAIADVSVRNVLQAFLTLIFSENDKATNDLARMFYGGKEIIYADYDHTLDPMKIIDAAVRYIYDTDYSHASRKIESLCKSVGLDMINGFPAVISGKIEDSTIFGDSKLTTIEYIMVDSLISPNTTTFIFTRADLQHNNHSKRTYSGIVNHTFTKERLFQDADWSALESEDAMFRGFMDGSLWLYENELWGMATNLLLLDGGETKFLQGIAKRKEYDIGFWKYQIMAIKKKQYAPMRYENYYSPKLQKPEALNMLQIARRERGKIEMISKANQITLKDAEKALNMAFSLAMSSADNGVYVIKAPTGIGKTVLYETIRDTTIAVPTHALKDEVYQRMLNADNTALLSPEMPEDIPYEVKATVENLYRIGATKAVSVYLRNEAKNNPVVAEYVEQKDFTAKVRDQNLITTHSRLFHLAATNDTILVDEDILGTMFPINHASVKDVLYMEEVSIPKGFGRTRREWPMNNIIQFIREASNFIVCPMPSYKLTTAELKEIETAVINKKLTSNVVGLLSATHFYKTVSENGVDTVHYIQRKDLPRDKKVIILSATANEDVYRLVFGDKLKDFTDIGKVEMKGKIHQMVGINTSRSAFAQHPEYIDRIKEIIMDLLGENATVITYKKLMEKFNAVANFGGLVGLDKHKGKDIAIVGTPNVSDVVYLLFASALGIKIKPEFDDIQAYAQVTRNGFRFDFMTYTRNEALREIQFYLVESELEQAVGRARPLREDVMVLVFSNLPISGAKIIYIKDEDAINKSRKIKRIETSQPVMAYA